MNGNDAHRRRRRVPDPPLLPPREETGRSCAPQLRLRSSSPPSPPAHRGAARTRPCLRADGRHPGSGAVVPGALRRLPGREHLQHDHLVQERTGFLRPHPQLQTRPDVSASLTAVYQVLDQKKFLSKSILVALILVISHLISISYFIYVAALSSLLCGP